MSAQSYLIEYYKKFGFDVYGEEYLEDEIPHIKMIKKYNLICFNGEIVEDKDFSISHDNRYLLYGDGFFETLKYVPNKILFWEEHYFRMMGSLCMLRFNIPTFNEEYFKNKINKTIES